MEHNKCTSCNSRSYVIPIEGLPPTFTSLLPWNTIPVSRFLKLFCVLCRILDWCTTATLAANHCAAPAGSWLTRPECFPTTTSCLWPNVPKPNTGSAVRKKKPKFPRDVTMPHILYIICTFWVDFTWSRLIFLNILSSPPNEWLNQIVPTVFLFFSFTL